MKSLAQKNIFLITAIGDFNAKFTNWYNKDKTNFEGNTIDTSIAWIASVNEPRNILQNSFSCIDLIFTSRSNLEFESGVHYSLHSSCHHQTVFAKFNLKICYPPSYSRQAWNFKEAETGLIRRALNDFNWERAF